MVTTIRLSRQPTTSDAQVISLATRQRLSPRTTHLTAAARLAVQRIDDRAAQQASRDRHISNHPFGSPRSKTPRSSTKRIGASAF